MNLHEEIRGLLPSLDGWTDVEKGLFLCDLILKAKPKLVVEIGTFGGKSALSMALPMKELGIGKLICIDPWNAQASAEGQTEEASHRWWSECDHEGVFKRFMFQISRYKLESVIEVRRQRSSEGESPKDIDILHLDGNHGPDALADAEKYAPNVKLGGWAILDDMEWVGGYVKRAAQFCESIGFVKSKTIGTGAAYQRMEMGTPKKAEEAAKNWEGKATSPLIVENDPRAQAAKKLTIAYITSRKKPMLEWFYDSLENQGIPEASVIVVSLHAEEGLTTLATTWSSSKWKTTRPKPTIWQGQSRITKEDWWAMSNARNTAICLCETEWLACVDDRCVLMPGWSDAIIDAINGNYVMCGTYQKRIDMKVENGFITDGGTIIGEDHRIINHPNGLTNCPGEWLFGCCFALPLEWALEVNGFSEDYCDGLSGEDSYFGKHLKNSGKPMKFDPRARIVEDRTPSEITDVMIRTDKGKSPLDKSHKCKDILSASKTSLNSFDIRKVREIILSGEPWPMPTAKHFDWYDGQPISEMVRT